MRKIRKLNSSEGDEVIGEVLPEVDDGVEPPEAKTSLLPGASVSLNISADSIVNLISPTKEKRVENARQLNHVLSFKNLQIVFLEPDYGNCFYSAIAYAIEQLPPPFNISYPVIVLRHKVAEYMIGHQSKFIKVFKTEDTLKKYCEAIATTRMYASTGTEFLAMANALQIKIHLYSAFKLAPDGFLIEEHGDAYSQVIKIAFIERSEEFLPIVDM